MEKTIYLPDSEKLIHTPKGWMHVMLNGMTSKITIAQLVEMIRNLTLRINHMERERNLMENSIKNLTLPKEFYQALTELKASCPPEMRVTLGNLVKSLECK